MEIKPDEGIEFDEFFHGLEGTSRDVEKNLKRMETTISILNKKPKPVRPLFHSQDFELKRITNDYKTEKLKDTITRVQESKHEILKKAKIQVKNETKKELFEVLQKIHQQFYNENQIMLQESNTKNHRLISKTKELDNSISILSHQNSVIKTFNLDDIPMIILPENKNYENIQELKATIKALTADFEAIKVVNSEYKKEAEEASEKVKKADVLLEKIKNLHVQAVNKMHDRIGKRENEVLMEIQGIKAEYEDFKFKIKQELEIRKLLQGRQHEFIRTLLDDLKNMKIILQNPTLRMKTYQKLKQSISAMENEQKLPCIGSSMTADVKKSREMLLSRSTHVKIRAKSSFKP